MKKALLVSNSGQSAASLASLLRQEGYDSVKTCFAAYSAVEAVEDDEFDLVCVNAPLPDENGIKLSKRLADTTRSCVVIIVPQKNADEINDVLSPCGVLVISKPINRHLFHHFLQFSDCFRTRILRFSDENEKLKHYVEDMNVINRAKLLLISCLNMSENQAHRYIEKQSMDLRVSKVAVAKQVIKTYEN